MHFRKEETVELFLVVSQDSPSIAYQSNLGCKVIGGDAHQSDLRMSAHGRLQVHVTIVSSGLVHKNTDCIGLIGNVDAFVWWRSEMT